MPDPTPQSPPPTDEELAELQALCDGATPGPWYIDTPQKPAPAGLREVAQLSPYWRKDASVLCRPEAADASGHGRQLRDAAFIAAARSAVPRLLADLEAAREKNRELHRRCQQAEQVAAGHLSRPGGRLVRGMVGYRNRKLEEERDALRAALRWYVDNCRDCDGHGDTLHGYWGEGRYREPEPGPCPTCAEARALLAAGAEKAPGEGTDGA